MRNGSTEQVLLDGSRPVFFQYYVFWSRSPEPSSAERAAGVYLVPVAEARYLQAFLEPLYGSAGIAISTSRDEIVSGDGLSALSRAIAEAGADVLERPESWPVMIGYTFEAFQIGKGVPIIKYASRQSLLSFLRGVSEIIDKARLAGGHVHFGGGG